MGGGAVVMYVEHPFVDPPENTDAPIWRYINFAKFIDVLERRALHFSQLKALGDAWEGTPSIQSLNELRRQSEEDRIKLIADGTASQDFQWGTSVGSTFQGFRLLTYVNCWHMNEFESLAMWELYSRDGVAIRSTFNRLAASLASVPNQIMIGQVVYRDRRFAVPGEIPADAFSTAFRKGMSFEHERELRAILLSGPKSEVRKGYTHEELETFGKNGITIEPIDLDTLIDAIYVAPGRPAWFRELVGKVMETYNLARPLVNSELDERPELT